MNDVATHLVAFVAGGLTTTWVLNLAQLVRTALSQPPDQ